MVKTHDGPLKEGFAMLGLIKIGLRKKVTPKCRDVDFGVKHSKKQCPD